MELISREKVLEILNYNCTQAIKVFNKTYHLPTRTISSKAIEEIKRLPSEWVEINEAPFGKVYQNSFVTFLSTETYDVVRRRLRRPKGKWIDNGQVRKIGGYSADCSVCGERSEYLTNFCGNCGADMRGEE